MSQARKLRRRAKRTERREIAEIHNPLMSEKVEREWCAARGLEYVKATPLLARTRC